jgi:hypothetical protein
MNEYQQFSLVFFTGVALPLLVIGTYWFAVDSAKRYVDKEIRKVKR